MTAPQMSDKFTTAFRRALIQHVETPSRSRRHRWLLGGGIGAVAIFAGTATAAATGLLPLPGAAVVTPVSASAVGTYTGTATLQLGPAPDGATGLTVSLNCLTPGTFTLTGGSSLTCSANDFLRPEQVPGFDSFFTPLTDAPDGALTVTASAGSGWRAIVAYATSETTAWAENAAGQSYGVTNENGDPDLIAVVANNGAQGYVHRGDLEDADGTTAQRSFTTPEDALEWQKQNAGITHAIPVYDSDGTTLVGEFDVG
ncbi:MULTISPECIES: peptidase M56 family protein [unclassified Rathayibacter]|uniref:peptidase M56 family protein n=1 Tax=unclassified Rathayibacter TaxID=2609250 RepID=UPI000F4C4CA8|nr:MULTISPECIES: peptidase M56 family protein [unclassified Rathayibacter]ROP50175.1 hypothetical protein EDF45_1584 [Rathayibacter sp. PhB186]ROS53133.1 hypothetical protein EDF44_1584 [Rathayibacter sp. PhB185]